MGPGADPLGGSDRGLVSHFKLVRSLLVLSGRKCRMLCRWDSREKKKKWGAKIWNRQAALY